MIIPSHESFNKFNKPRSEKYNRADIAKKHFVKRYGYPRDVGRLVYDPPFAVRCEVDSSRKIQLGTVYRGRQKLEEQKVFSMYKRRQLPVGRLFY